MSSYLLDSDVLIWVLRGRVLTVDMVERLIDESEEPLACSALSVLEIEVGVRPGEEAATARLFDGLTILPVTSPIAREAAKLLRKRKRMAPRDWVDALIAATALAHGRMLVTDNRRDYPYPQLKLYPT